MPGIGLGEGASLAFGADGGPIRSNDRFDTRFSTGSFSLKGGSDSSLNQVVLVLVGMAVGVVLWQLISSRS